MRSDERVRRRNESKAKLAVALAPMYRGEVDAEVIIRDADRDDGYPQADAKFRALRISPWFKAELLKPWGDGISVWLGMEWVVVADGKARVVAREEPGEWIRVVGRIPYEVVSDVDPDGDVDYPMPQIFCHFDFSRAREPYSEIVAFRDHGDDHWFAMEGVRIEGRSRSSLWRRWRLHRQMEKYQREVEREHPQIPPTLPPSSTD